MVGKIKQAYVILEGSTLIGTAIESGVQDMSLPH
jgi:hypothetical protein